MTNLCILIVCFDIGCFRSIIKRRRLGLTVMIIIRQINFDSNELVSLPRTLRLPKCYQCSHIKYVYCVTQCI